MTRRAMIFQGLAYALVGATALGAGSIAYATGIEPFAVRRTRYRVTPASWPAGVTLKIAMLADLHAHRRFLGIQDLRTLLAHVREEEPDLVLFLGDYCSQEPEALTPEEVAAELARFEARYGVYAVLGNHDWTDDMVLQASGIGETRTARAFREAGIQILDGDALPLAMAGHSVWIAGLPSEYTIQPGARRNRLGYRSARTKHSPETMARALRDVPEDAAVILMAHEPDVFALNLDPRIALQVSGHTHAGQIRLMGWSPFIPSRYGMRYAYGHIQENDRDLVVSAGLGGHCLMGRPIRIGAPPELVMIDLAQA